MTRAAFFSLGTAFFLTVFLVVAQNVRSQDKEGNDDSERQLLTNIYPGGNVYRLERHHNDGRIVPRFSPDNSSGIRLGPLRLLRFPTVQKELELTKQQLDDLEPLFRTLHDYEMLWKWQQAVICKPVVEESLEHTEALRKQIDEDDAVTDVLLPRQMERLLQIERRFLLFVMQDLRNLNSQFLTNRISVSPTQLSAISELVSKCKEEFEADCKQWETGALRPQLKDLLGEARFNLLDEVVKDSRLLSDHPLIRNAQMRPLFSYREIDGRFEHSASIFGPVDDDPDDLKFELIEPLILANGRFVPSHEHMNRSKVNLGWSKWQRLAVFLSEGRSKSFELVDFQVDELRQTVERREHPNLTGAFAYHFVGHDELISFIANADNSVRSDKDAYRDYVEKCIELNSKISRQVEQGIRKLLLPHQLNQLQLSIGEGQAGEMGIVHLLTAGLLGDDLKLSDKDTKILWDFVSKRNELENRKMKDLESAILAELTPEQREQFKADLGELPGFLPTLFLTN